jgi:AcrR family transcriptional regulator
VTRRYDSSRRQEQARETRRAILSAAYDLFVRDGYAKTTIAAIARRAEVSPETIYAAFGSKPNVLKNVWDVTIGGDDEDVVFHERPEVVAIRNEPDLARRLELHAALIAEQIHPRVVPFMIALQGAATVEPSAAELLDEVDRQRYAGMSVMAREVAGSGQLKVSEEECLDIMWTTTRGELYHLLVMKRGWSTDRYARFLATLWTSMFVAD